MKNKFKISVFSTIVLFLLFGYAVSAQEKVPTILGNINKNNLKNYSYNFCRYSRNEIFARKGYAFKSKDLDIYFSAQPWYKKNTDATISLSENQKETINLFQDFEKK